jgi:hypothetical protein
MGIDHSRREPVMPQTDQCAFTIPLQQKLLYCTLAQEDKRLVGE